MTSSLPARELPPEDWEHYRLYKNVREAIASLPAYFRTETRISGIMATDVHTLNAVLGATIEDQVVRSLNGMRNTWDPDGQYALYSFVRQPQTFPDVLLRKSSGGEILLGIELKGWYLLAKEGEPSLRFQATTSACAKQDLIVVVPWVLADVISGSPIVLEPFIESARFAAAYRNYHWQHIRRTKQDKRILIPDGIKPYPAKSDQILDRPLSDAGGNFGRLARTSMRKPEPTAERGAWALARFLHRNQLPGEKEKNALAGTRLRFLAPKRRRANALRSLGKAFFSFSPAFGTHGAQKRAKAHAPKSTLRPITGFLHSLRHNGRLHGETQRLRTLWHQGPLLASVPQGVSGRQERRGGSSGAQEIGAQSA